MVPDTVEETSRSRRHGILIQPLKVAGSSGRLQFSQNIRIRKVLASISARYKAPRLVLVIVDSSMKQQITSQL